MKNIKGIIIAILLGITGFSVYKYSFAIKENSGLSANICQLNIDFKTLENVKSGLVKDLNQEKELNSAFKQENIELKDNLNQAKVKLAQMGIDLGASQKTIEDLASQISLSKAENVVLQDQIQRSRLDFNQVKADKEQLQSRLNSMLEPQKTIKELNQKVYSPEKQAQKRGETKKKIILGNNGFLIKNEKPVIGIVKIEVEPLPGS